MWRHRGDRLRSTEIDVQTRLRQKVSSSNNYVQATVAKQLSNKQLRTCAYTHLVDSGEVDAVISRFRQPDALQSLEEGHREKGALSNQVINQVGD